MSYDYAALREPFPKEQIGRLPATQKRPALDFVGHAAVTDRLNKFAPDWSYSIDELFNHDGACWIRGTFTVGGVSRPEYGDGKDPKEAIGNFIRRGAMRFGVAIDLWSREELDWKSADIEPSVGSVRSTGGGGMVDAEGSEERGTGEGPSTSEPTSTGDPNTPVAPDVSAPSGASPEQEQADAYIQVLRDGPGNTQSVLQARALFESDARKVRNLRDLTTDELLKVVQAFKEKVTA